MLVFLGFMLIILFGLFLSFILIPKMNPLERIGLSFILGLGLLTFLMFLLSWVGLKLNLLNGLLIQVVPILILSPFLKKKIILFFSDLKMSYSLKDFSLIEKLILFTICLLTVYSLINALYWPVNAWDALALYDFRAKMFANIGSITTLSPYYYNYPLLTSLAHVWVYLLGGNNPKFIYSMLYLSFILIFYHSLKKTGTPRIACLFFTLFLASDKFIFRHSMIAYTNLPFTVYLVTGTIFLYLWMIGGEFNYLTLSGLMFGLSSWVRGKEPFWLAALGVLIIYSLYRKKFLAPFWFSLFFFSFYQPWQIFRSRMIGHGFPLSQVAGNITELPTKLNFTLIKEIAVFLYQNVISSWQPVFYFFLIVLLLELRNFRREKNISFLFLVMANFLVLIFGMFFYAMITSLEWQEIPGSAARMAMFFIPLFIFYIASTRIIKELFDKTK